MTATRMPFATRSYRSFPQALKKAGLDAPACRKGSAEYEHQVNDLMLQLVVIGVDWRGVGGGLWYCAPLGGLDGHEPL